MRRPSFLLPVSDDILSGRGASSVNGPQAVTATAAGRGSNDGGFRAMPNAISSSGTPRARLRGRAAAMPCCSDRLLSCVRVPPTTALAHEARDVPSPVARDGVSRERHAHSSGSPARGVPLRIERTGRSGRPGFISRGRGRRRPYAAVSPNGWRSVGDARGQHIGDTTRRVGAARRLGAYLLRAWRLCASRRDAVDHRAGTGAAAVATSPVSPRPAA